MTGAAPVHAVVEPAGRLADRRRAHARQRARRLRFGAAVAALIAGGLAWRSLASPIIGYYVDSAVQLLLAVLGIVLVATGMVYVAIRLVDRFGRHALWDSLILFLGWNLLKSQRRAEPLRSRARRLVATWARTDRPGMRFLSWFLVGNLAGGVLAWALAQPPRPWSVWWTVLTGAVAGVAAFVATAAVLGMTGAVAGALRARRGVDPGPDAFRQPRLVQRNMVTTPTFIAIIGVAVGVWALIVVLSVMSGFQQDLRTKILRTQDHVQIQHEPETADAVGTIEDWPGLVDSLSGVEGVAAAWPYVHGEVMVSSRTNISTSVTVKGVWPGVLLPPGAVPSHAAAPGAAPPAAAASVGTIVSGSPEFLIHPERLLSDRSWADYEAGELPADIEAVRRRLRNVGKQGRGDSRGSDDGRGEAAGDGGDPDGEKAGVIPAPGPDPDDTGLDDELLALAAPARVFPGVLIGSELARSLNVVTGSEVQLITPEGAVGPAGVMPRSKSFRVAGVFHTGMYEYDMRLVYLDLGEAQRYFDHEDTVNRLELRLVDVTRTDEVLARVAPLLAGRGLEALDWKALNRSLFSALALEKVVMFIVLGFIILVASFAIVASLVMIVLEKSREIAILKSMGATNRAIRRTFMAIGVVIGIVGTAAGATLGLATCLVIDSVGFRLPKAYYIEFIPVDVDPLELIAIVAAGLAVCVLATLYPSNAAARLRPVEGLRYE